MRDSRRNFQNIIFKACLFGASSLCLLLGLTLCLVKSPQEKAEQYLAMASQYDERINNDLTIESQKFLLTGKQDLLFQAIQHDPNNHQIWIDLSFALASMDDLKSAVEASKIAQALDSNVDLSVEKLMAALPKDSPHLDKVARVDNQFQLSFTY